jgi:hypothetical protein
MMDRNDHSEHAPARELVGAGIGRGGDIAEQAEAHGRYVVECVGPREECRADYVRLRDEALAWEEAGILLERIVEHRRLMAAMVEPKWTDHIDNVVCTAGKNDLLDKYFAGSSYTAAWYVGLIDSGSYSAVAAGDTSASHAGWTENTAYSQGTRPAASWSAASAGAKALSSAAAFSITSDNQTIKGCFLITNSTKGGTTGILYSAGLFTVGDKEADNGDTLNVSYSASV